MSATEADKTVSELMTTAEVAKLISAGARTVWRWSRSGVMPPPLKLNPGRQGAVRFRRAEIMAWIEAGCPRAQKAKKGGRTIYQVVLTRFPLRIKTFYGNSVNAVKTQVWLAVSVYVLVAILKKELKLERSLTEILQILSVTPFEKTPSFQALSTFPTPNPESSCCKQLPLFDF